jgi:hypothetical protein
MNIEEATTILNELENSRCLKNEDANFIQNVFQALAVRDAHEIEVKAAQFLQTVDLETLRTNSIDEEEFLHRATMDTFYYSMLEFLQEHFPEVDSCVEHDINSWIEANAEHITVGYIKKMETFISEHSPQHNDVIEFHQKVNLNDCEAVLNGIFQQSWKDIELKING